MQGISGLLLWSSTEVVRAPEGDGGGDEGGNVESVRLPSFIFFRLFKARKFFIVHVGLIYVLTDACDKGKKDEEETRSDI